MWRFQSFALERLSESSSSRLLTLPLFLSASRPQKPLLLSRRRQLYPQNGGKVLALPVASYVHRRPGFLSLVSLTQLHAAAFMVRIGSTIVLCSHLESHDDVTLLLAL